MPLVFCYVCVFVLGLAIGSFINICVARLPYEKSLLWPGSRCPTCVQPIAWYHNIPLISFLVLGGKCRTCGQLIPLKYFLVELGTALSLVALFHVEMAENWLDLPLIRRLGPTVTGNVPLAATAVFAHHAILVSFLIVASLCDLADMEIPLSVTLSGTLVGLAFSTCMPWPFPHEIPLAGREGTYPPWPGAHAWPVWYPLPDWLPAGSPQLGLATGLAGALAGMFVLRMVRFLFTLGRGIEGLGVGDADLMMMVGAFIGWQPVVLAFFVSVFPGLFLALALLLTRGEQALPFGPALALGTLITMLFWPALGPQFRLAFFDPIFIGILTAAGCLALLVTAFLLRVIRGT